MAWATVIGVAAPAVGVVDVVRSGANRVTTKAMTVRVTVRRVPRVGVMGSLSGLVARVLIGGNPCVMLGDMDALQLLADERARTEVRLAALRSDFAGMVAASESSNADDEHDPEGATIAFERSQVDALLRAAERQLEEVDAAVGAGARRDVRRVRGVRYADPGRAAGGAADHDDLRRPRLTLGVLGRMDPCNRD